MTGHFGAVNVNGVASQDGTELFKQVSNGELHITWHCASDQAVGQVRRHEVFKSVHHWAHEWHARHVLARGAGVGGGGGLGLGTNGVANWATKSH